MEVSRNCECLSFQRALQKEIALAQKEIGCGLQVVLSCWHEGRVWCRKENIASNYAQFLTITLFHGCWTHAFQKRPLSPRFLADILRLAFCFTDVDKREALLGVCLSFSIATNSKSRKILGNLVQLAVFRGRKEKWLAWNLLRLVHLHFLLMKSVRWRDN